MEGSGVVEQTATDAAYYCPQCGARYSGPGLCANGHADAEVVALGADAAEQDGTSEPTPAQEPTEPAPPATKPAPPATGLAPPAVELASPAAPAGVWTGDVATEAGAVIAGVRDALAHLESLFGIGGA